MTAEILACLLAGCVLASRWEVGRLRRRLAAERQAVDWLSRQLCQQQGPRRTAERTLLRAAVRGLEGQDPTAPQHVAAWALGEIEHTKEERKP